ncbi:hypothetical protein RB195_000914 [Necator americanus]|uniref:Uncharacterized protein n=1 Tax=Necator americanus TaxID=51031 RepID=A0ABR1DDK1_NECAM
MRLHCLSHGNFLYWADIRDSRSIAATTLTPYSDGTSALCAWRPANSQAIKAALFFPATSSLPNAICACTLSETYELFEIAAAALLRLFPGRYCMLVGFILRF